MKAPLFRDRGRGAQILLAVVAPFALGAVLGVVLGISSGGYWGLSALAALGGFLAGFEHEGGADGARRGVLGGALFGAGLLLAHAIAGTHAKVSLGSVPLLLVLIDAIIGALLGALGARAAQAAGQRESSSGAP
jgi:hypothetical protein